MSHWPPDQGNPTGCGSREVVAHEVLGESIRRLIFASPEIAAMAQPGQFVHLRVDQGFDPFLRRPFSIHRLDPEKGHVSILYRIVGRGTERLSHYRRGDSIDVMGPLGRPFDLRMPFDHALIVAGGMGIAPVLFLAEELQRLGKGVTVLWGTKTKGDLIDLDFSLRGRASALRFATEDGSKGHAGRVTDLLEAYLGERSDPQGLCGFVCGPVPMILAVQRMVERTPFPWQVSLEEHMACGTGVCQGCGIRIRGEPSYRMVCVDGPVFDLRGVVLDG